MTAKEYGKLAFFMGKPKLPTMDINFANAFLIDTDIHSFNKAINDWLDGWEEEELQEEGV